MSHWFLKGVNEMEFFEPRISSDTAVFWEGCKAHQLNFQRCKECGKVRWPAGRFCPDCLSENTEIVSLPLEGELYSYVVMHKPFHPSLAEKVPYTVGLIDLKDGIRILANICDEDMDGIRCGDRVTIDWSDGETYSRPIARRKEKQE